MEAVESIVRMSEKYPDAYATVVEKLWQHLTEVKKKERQVSLGGMKVFINGCAEAIMQFYHKSFENQSPQALSILDQQWKTNIWNTGPYSMANYLSNFTRYISEWNLEKARTEADNFLTAFNTNTANPVYAGLDFTIAHTEQIFVENSVDSIIA